MVLSRVFNAAFAVCLAALLFAPMAAQEPPTGAADNPVDRNETVERRREGDMLIDITGRIENLKLDLRQGTANRSVFRPTDGKIHYILLENQLLERLEKVTAQGEVLVKVSGQITEYNGKNYLLLTRASVKRGD